MPSRDDSGADRPAGTGADRDRRDRRETVLGPDDTGGLGTLRIRHPRGTFAPTPASRVTVAAIGASRDRLSGTGIDWGTGVGCVALAAARAPGVDRVIGLELRSENVRAARANAVANGVADTVLFLRCDSWEPVDPEDRRVLAELEGRAGFVAANPPGSTGDDGFGWRRTVARGAVVYLRPGGLLLAQVSSQYGPERVRSLEDEGPGLRWDGIAASTGWVPFDADRSHLLRNLRTFAAAEADGAPAYAFRRPDDPAASMTAREALDHYRETGTSPLSRWQVQRFVFRPEATAPSSS